MNNVLIIDDLLTHEECDEIIEKYSPQFGELLEPPRNFKFVDIPPDNTFVYNKGIELIRAYQEKFPAINLTKDMWRLEYFKFKEFPAGKHYDSWHQEHTIDNPHRIACVIVYLSDHNCGTEFFHGDTVLSKKGRGVIFPTFWTHTHKGQICPDNKSRFIMNAYVNLFAKQ
jgi:hypothetical protein